MTDHAALLAAVLESPDNDVPRLLMADWLRDNGQWERGEFVAVQCEIAAFDERAPWAFSRRKCSGHGWVDSRCPECWPFTKECGDQLRARERELTPFINIDGVSTALTGEFRRGFLHTIRTTAAEWQRETQEMYVERLPVSAIVGDLPWPPRTAPIHRRTVGQLILSQHPVVRVEFADNNAIEIAHQLREDRPPWCLSWFYNDPVCLTAYCPTRAALIDIMPAQLREWGVGEVVRQVPRHEWTSQVATAAIAAPPPPSISSATGRG